MAKLQSVDELLESALLAIYRRWSYLPRRTTLPALEQLRGLLAEQLVELSADPEPGGLRRAAAAFAAAALQLPQVRGVAGGDLDKLVALGDPAGRMLPLLATRPLTAERLLALSQLARCADPPGCAVQRWFYVANETAEAWRALRPAVEQVLDRLPETTRQQLELLDTALAASLSTPSALGAYEEALNRLEALPGIVAALTDRFLHWKAEQRLLRRSAGAMPVLESTALAEEGDAARGDELELAAAPSAPSESLQVNFHTEVKFPAAVQRWQVNWLVVRLRLQQPAESAARGRIPVEFSQPEQGAPPPEVLTVRVLAADFEEETLCWERTLTVWADRDSDPAVFLLKSGSLGAKRIAIDFYHKARLVGSVSLQTEVVQQAGTGASAAVARGGENLPEFARFERQPPPPADLHLRVVKKAQENTLAFWLDSPRADVPYRWQFMGETELTDKDPLAFLARELAPLTELVRLLASDLTAAEQAQSALQLATLAEGLFEQLLPEPLREAYFAQIVPLHEAGVIRTLLITSDEPWIPWELLKPYHYNVHSGQEYSDDFWATRFRLARWLAGRGPLARLTVDTAALVFPEVGLPAMAAERRFFDTLSAQRRVQLAGPLQLRQEVLDLFMAGGYQVMHIATHGQFNSEDADRSVLELADAPLYPGDLRGSQLRGMRRAMPLVFLNACDGGRANFSLTGLGGWADKLFREANASAFVGALWEVHDALAVEFSTHFYSRLEAGDVLGEAMRAARLHVRALEPHNPTWLAYTLYGDPNGSVQVGSA